MSIGLECNPSQVNIGTDSGRHGLPEPPRKKVEALRKRINRAEANDKAGRLRILTGNMTLLESILGEMYTQGKLDFLKEPNDGK